MSAQNVKTDDKNSSGEALYNLLLEVSRAPGSYIKNNEDTVGKVINEMKKDRTYWEVDFDDPVTGAYYTVVQSHNMDEEAKSLSKLIKNIDEVAPNELIDNQQLFIYRLYELSSNETVDITNITASEVKQLNHYAKILGKLGTVADVAEYSAYAGRFASAWVDGDRKGMTDEVSNLIGSLACGTIASEIATAFIAALSVTNPLVAFAAFAVFGIAGSALGEEIAEGWKMIFDEIFGSYNDAGAYTYPCDPLIFDLNGDGVKTVSVADGVHFDFDKNGFSEKIGWVSAEDGLLVRDLNNDGKISSGRELMGDLTELSENSVASNGFQAIGYYDENRDGVINSNDAIYSELKIWQDKNQNGTVDDEELMTLSQVGIESINVSYDYINETDENGNSHSQKGSYTRTDGTTGEIEDVWFVKDAADTVLSVENNEQYYIEETDEIRNLPDIQGKGNQYSLHQAMLRDETGRLQEMVEEYVAEEDVYNRKKMLSDLIYAWTGVLDEDKFGRGEFLSDARKLEALEVITGRDFTSAYGANPVEGAVDFIEDAFDRLVYMYHIQLEMQTTYAGMYATIWQNVDIDENDNIVFKADGLKDYLAPIVEQDPEKVKRMITGFIDNMNKTGIASQVDMNSFREEMSNNKLIDGKVNDTYIFHPEDGMLDNVYIMKAA